MKTWLFFLKKSKEDEMKHLPYGWMIAGYIAMVIFSFLLLVGLAMDFEQKHPSLINKKWKKVLWLLSCLFFIPYLVFISGFPSFFKEATKRFFSIGKENKDK